MENERQNIQKTLAGFIQKYEAEHNLLQAQMVEKINSYYGKKVISQSQLSKIETCSALPRSYCFYLICNALEIDPSEIFPIIAKRTSYQKKNCLDSKETFVDSLTTNLNKIITPKTEEAKNSSPTRDHQLVPWCNKWIALEMSDKLWSSGGQQKDSIAEYTIYRYLHEGRNMPLDHLIALCKILNVEASDLID